jgi:ATP-dependent RNA helicase DDX41
MVAVASGSRQAQAQVSTGDSDLIEGMDIPEDYKPYVPVAKRRAQLRSTLTGKHNAKKSKVSLEELQKERLVDLGEEDEAERIKEQLRKERTLLQAAQEVKERKAAEGELWVHLRRHEEDSGNVRSMLMRRDVQKSQADIAAEKEAKLLKELERGQKKLAGAKEISQGTAYTESLKTS